MKRAVFPAIALVLAAAIIGHGQTMDLSNYGVRIEPDKRVMTVLATLEAARTVNSDGEPEPVIKTPLSADGVRFRDQLSSDLAVLSPDLRQRISNFVIQYKKRNPGKTDAEIVAPFISMAYSLSPAPELADPVVTSDLPASLLDVLDFAPLVRDFYRRSSFSANLPEYVKTYRSAADAKLRPSAQDMVSELLGYMHTRPQTTFSEKVRTEVKKSGSKKSTLTNTAVREHERTFTIVPEMLAPAGTVLFLNVKDDYVVIIPPDTDLSISEARRGFLQYVIDPIVLSRSKEIEAMRPGIKALLDDKRTAKPELSPDVYLTISRSLVAAIDAKQSENLKVRIATAQSREKLAKTGPDPEKKVYNELQRFKQAQADEALLRLSEDYEKGAILDFYFAEQLDGVEESQFDLAASLREMLLSFDPAKEKDRYARYEAERARALAARSAKNTGTAAVIAANPVTTRLIEIEKTIDAKNYAKATSDLSELGRGNPSDARIFYALGRVASLEAGTAADADSQRAHLLAAKKNYEEVVKIARNSAVDKALLSLSYVALAKIYEFYDDAGYATALYDEAIKVGRVQGGAFDQAIAAKQRLIKQK